MKKQFILLLASLIMGSILSSCNDNNITTNSTDSRDGSNTDITSEVVPTDWNEDLKTKMSDSFSVVVPFFYIKNYQISFDETKSTFSVTTKEGSIVEDLKTIEKAFSLDTKWQQEVAVSSDSEKPSYGKYSLIDKLSLSETGSDLYTVYAEYGLSTASDNFGKVSEGSLNFTVYLEKDVVITNTSASYDSWAEMRNNVINIFADQGYSDLILPEDIATSATSFNSDDVRYYNYITFNQVTTPSQTLYLVGGLETEVYDVANLFTALGYVETTDSGDEESYYVKDSFEVNIYFMEGFGILIQIDIVEGK